MVFPAPGGACKIRLLLALRLLRKDGMISDMGSVDAMDWMISSWLVSFGGESAWREVEGDLMALNLVMTD